MKSLQDGLANQAEHDEDGEGSENLFLQFGDGQRHGRVIEADGRVAADF